MSTPILRAAEQIPGWMSPAELAWLATASAQSHAIAEIGCWKGRSTLVLAACTPGRLWAIDHWEGQHDDPTAAPSLEIRERGAAAIRAEFDRHLAPYTDRLTVLTMTSAQAAIELRRAGVRFDFVFIDGAHEEAAVAADILDYRGLLCPGGLLAGHDYRSPHKPHRGVTLAVDHLVGPVETVDFIWWRRV